MCADSSATQVSFVTTSDTCSNCGAKLSNAETARLNFQKAAYDLDQALRIARDVLLETKRMHLRDDENLAWLQRRDAALEQCEKLLNPWD